jgi:hypothetical protein
MREEPWSAVGKKAGSHEKDLVPNGACWASSQRSHVDAGRNPLHRDAGHLPVGEVASQACQV